MKKYVIYKDYLAHQGPTCGYSYEAIEAPDLIGAIEQADAMWNHEDDKLYLMRIMEKRGNIVTPYRAGYKYQIYEAVLCRRSYGWHLNTIENSEGEHIVSMNWPKNDRNYIWYELEYRAF